MEYSNWVKSISEVENSKEKGDIFEKFFDDIFTAKGSEIFPNFIAYYNTNKYQNIKELEKLGIKIRGKKFNSIGIDAVLITDKITLIQYKFCSSKKLNCDLGNFYQEYARLKNENYNIPMLITTAKEIPDRDLEDCEVYDYYKIEEYFFPYFQDSSKKFRNTFSLTLEQEKIITKCESFDNILLYLVPGYGKTLLSYFLSQGFSKILILVPKRPLLFQHMENWKKINPNLNVLPVCTDLRAGKTFLKETTNFEEISQISNKFDNLVVMSTYQSVDKVMSSDFIPEVIIYDEAHKISKNKYNTDCFLNFNCKKKVFLTATPGEIENYVSNLPNSIIMKKNFREAISEDRLSDFFFYALETPVNTFSKDMIQVEVENKSWLVKRAFEKGLCKKMMAFVSYHETAKIYKKFLKSIMPDVKIISDIANNTSEKRRNLIRIFSESETKIIMISVKVFLEGIDIKDCDSVVFLSGIKSKKNIIQAVGRALRFQNRKICKIIIPTIVEESLETQDSRYEIILEIMKSIDMGEDIDYKNIRDKIVVERVKISDSKFIPEKMDKNYYFANLVDKIINRKGVSKYSIHKKFLKEHEINSYIKYVKFRETFSFLPENPQSFYLEDFKDWNDFFSYSKKIDKILISEVRKIVCDHLERENLKIKFWNFREVYDKLADIYDLPPYIKNLSLVFPQDIDDIF